MIQVDFNILNQKGSPALYQDVFASRPAASLAGRIFLATDTGNLYRDTGTTWASIAGGGGGTGGIDDVLAVNQVFSANRNIDGNGYNFTIEYYNNFSLKNSSGETYLKQLSYEISIGDVTFANNGTQFGIDDFNKLIYTYHGANLSGIDINFNAGNNFYRFGDFTYGAGVNIEIDNTNGSIKTYQGNTTVNRGLRMALFSGQYDFGAINEDAYLNVNPSGGVGLQIKGVYNSNPQLINCEISSTNYEKILIGTDLNVSTGILIDKNIPTGACQYSFGDYNQVLSTNGTSLQITNSIGLLNLFMQDFYLDDRGSGNLLQPTSGPVSGQHLKITINGVPYVIELKTP